MKDVRRGDDAKLGSATRAEPAAGPGKQTQVQRVVFGAAAVGDDGPAPAVSAGPDPVALDEPSAPAKPDKPVKPPPKPSVTVAFPETAAPPLTFSAKDYRELYQQVAARAGQEAGSVTKSMSSDTQRKDDGTVVSASFTIGLATMLPEWTEKASQPKDDQDKFNAWRQSVSTHETGHRDIYKKEYAKLKTQVVGPTKEDVSNQADAVSAVADQAQNAYDASNQPAALAIPGGMEKVKSTDASDVAAPDDTAVA